MQKYLTAQQMSPQRKSLLINRAMSGEPISTICKREGISRTIFYRWLRQHNQQDTLVRRPCKKTYTKKIALRVEKKVLSFAIKHPKSTLNEIAQLSGISTTMAWKLLNSKKISNRNQRKKYLATHGSGIYPVTSYDAKIALLQRCQQGEKISDLCKEAQISRTIFYRWLKRYKQAGESYSALRSLRLNGEKHWRFRKDAQSTILDTVRMHPDYSFTQIYSKVTAENGKIISMSGAYYILKRLHLTTLKERYAYAATAAKLTMNLHPLPEEELPAIPEYSFISFLSPPERDQVFLLHLLFFDELHLPPQHSTSCEICSLIQYPANQIVFDESLFANEIVDESEGKEDVNHER